MSCRCSSCGYIHEVNDTERPVLDAEPVAVAAVVIPMVVQSAVCPLCREPFEDIELYDAHRARNCGPAPQWCPVCGSLFENPADYDSHVAAATCQAPEDTTIPEGGNPLVTDPANPAAPQE